MSLKEFDNTNNNTKNKCKSPLRYPGGKSKAIKYLKKFIPDNTTKLISPFLGGGSFEIYCCANMGIKVYGYDIFEPLVEFWECLLEDSKKLADYVYPYYPFSKDDFHKIREAHTYHPDKYERAAIYYVLNRNAFSGKVFTGGYSVTTERFTLSAINRVRDFNLLNNNNLSVGCMDFKHSITKDNNKILLYCDPPYIVKNPGLYGYTSDLHKEFNHKLLADLLRGRDKWILSYNDNKYIRDLYKGYKIYEFQWIYSTNHKKNNELLIVSDDLKI